MPRPTTADSQFSQETFPDDDRMSYESRSLAAYSNFSGRDSVLDNGLNSNGYRYPYPSEPEQDKPNPFVRGTEIHREANTNVQAYLRHHNNQVINRYADSVSSSVISTSDSAKPIPGRIEDLPSPTSPFKVSSNTEDDELLLSPTGSASSRQKIKQLREEYLNRSPEELVLQKPKTNKYLKEENRWTSPVKKTKDEVDKMNGMGVEVSSGVVSSYHVPEMHHAQMVTLRRDSSSSSSSSDSEGAANPPSHMILQSPMVPLPTKVRQPRPTEQPPPPPPPALPKKGVPAVVRNSFMSSGGHSGTIQAPTEEKPVEFGFQNNEKFQEPPKKKGGFFASLFKKKGDNKNKNTNGTSTSVEYETSGESSGNESTSEDESEIPKRQPFIRGQPGLRPNRSVEIPIQREPPPTLPKPQNPQVNGEAPVYGNISKPDFERQKSDTSSESGPLSSSSPLPPPPPPEELAGFVRHELERRPSQSKPTNLDDRLVEVERKNSVSEMSSAELPRDEPPNSHVSQSHQQFQHFEATSIHFTTEALAKMIPSPDDPLYANVVKGSRKIENSISASHDTTQEIDVDEALGYQTSDDEEQSKKSVEKVEWPNAGATSLREPVEMHPDFHRPSDSPTKESKKKKPGFFNFGRKKEERQPLPELPIDEKTFPGPVIDVVAQSRQEQRSQLEAESAPEQHFSVEIRRKSRKDSPASVSSKSSPSSRASSKSPQRASSDPRRSFQKSSGMLGGLFKSPFSESRNKRTTQRPKSFGGLGGAVDVSHYLDDDETPMPKKLERNVSTTTDDDAADPTYQHISQSTMPVSRQESQGQQSQGQETGSLTSSRSSIVEPVKEKKRGFFSFGSKRKIKNKDKQIRPNQNLSKHRSTGFLNQQSDRSRSGSRTSIDRQSLSSFPDDQSQNQGSFNRNSKRRSGFWGSKPRGPPKMNTMPTSRSMAGGFSVPQGPQGPRGRSSSMPRPRNSSGLSGLFGVKPNPRRGPPMSSRRGSFEEGFSEMAPQRGVPANRGGHHSLPRRRPGGGGFGSMFNVGGPRGRGRAPPRRGPPPPMDYDEEYDQAMHPAQSLPRRKPTGSLGNLFGGNSARRSGRRPPMRSQPNTPTGRTPPNRFPDMDDMIPATPNERRPQQELPSEANERRERSSSPSEKSPQVEVKQAPTPNNTSVDPVHPRSDSLTSQRQMGRRSGRFRKQPGSTSNGSAPRFGQSQSSHDLSLPPSAARAQNNEARANALFGTPSRASPVSMSASNLLQDSIDLAPEESELSQKDRMRSTTKSATSLARTESYRQAKNAPLKDEAIPGVNNGLPPRQSKSHSSMPRLGNKNKPILTEFKGGPHSKDDLDSRSLGARSDISRKGGPDPCVVM